MYGDFGRDSGCDLDGHAAGATESMKKRMKVTALLLAMTLLGAQPIAVQAKLTTQEQEAQEEKRLEAAKKQREAARAAETEKKETGPLIAIDPGHQGPGFDMSGVEPNGPGSDVMKARLATGTSGTATGKPEYELNLEVSLKLEQVLLDRGYEVVMTRRDNETDISNIERCEVAHEAGADIMVRIHANGSDDSSVAGALTIAPSESNPYTQEIQSECVRLSQEIVNAYCDKTGIANRDLWITDDMTGINWSEIPVTIVEMGFMTNPGDDTYMADEANQQIMAEGIADGIDAYFGRQ